VKPTILTYGEVWPGTHSALICAAAHRRGYAATAFDFYQSRLFAGSRSVLARAARRILKPANSARINRGFRQAIEAVRPSTIIVSKGVDLHPETLRFAEKLSIKLINWSPDDFLNRANSSTHLVNALPIYDLLVSARAHRFPVYRQHGARRLLYIDWYYIPEIHYPRAVPKDIVLGFVGSWSKDREAALARIKTRCTIYGGGWGRASAQLGRRHDIYNRVLNHDEYPLLLSRTKFSLNFFTKENFDRSNQRLFEVPACGSVLVSEASEVATAVFGADACISFNLPEQVDSLLKDDPERETIGRRATRILESGPYTFDARFEALIPHLA
jgi:spore maturation protein CgeB